MDHWRKKEEIKKYLETNKKRKKKPIMIQNLWDTAEAVLRGKFMPIKAYLRKQEKSQINHLNLLIMELEKEEWTKPKISSRKEIIKAKAEINEIEIEKIMEDQWK